MRLFFLSLFLLLPDRERRARSRKSYRRNSAVPFKYEASRTRCSILEGVGKIVEGKIAPRATFHFPAKCALLRPPTNNDFHRFDETFFLPNTIFLPSLLPLLSLSLSCTRHTRLILVYLNIRIGCCFVSRIEIRFCYSCDKLLGKKFTLVSRLIYNSGCFLFFIETFRLNFYYIIDIVDRKMILLFIRFSSGYLLLIHIPNNDSRINN